MIKRIFLIVLCALPLTIMAQDLKFGYFNRQEVFMSMPETIEAQKKLDQLSKDYEAELLKMQQEYQKKGSEFVAARDTLPESIKTRRMAEIQDLEQRLQSFYQDSQKDIQKQQEKLITPINKKLTDAVKAVGDENGFVYIVDANTNAGVLYYSQSKCVDVTNLVRTKLNLK